MHLEIWLDARPTGQREPIFAATLHLDESLLAIHAFDERFHPTVPPGDYTMSITQVNAGKDSGALLTDNEYFQRDDLQRYEVVLDRRNSDR